MLEIGHQVDGNIDVFTVTDSGVGFEMRYLNKMIGVVQRLHPSNEFDSTGAELAIVQRILPRHGGRLLPHGMLRQRTTVSCVVSWP